MLYQTMGRIFDLVVQNTLRSRMMTYFYVDLSLRK